MSLRTTVNLVQTASRIAWGSFYISYSVDAGWSVYDSRAIKGRALLASGLTFEKAVKRAFDLLQDETFDQRRFSPNKGDGKDKGT